MISRRKLRRTVLQELRKVRSYRHALRTPDAIPREERERMEAWVRVGDDLLLMLREEEAFGRSLARYADALYGITRRPIGSERYVTTWAMDTFHMSEAGLRCWKDMTVYSASILALAHGAINLSTGG